MAGNLESALWRCCSRTDVAESTHGLVGGGEVTRTSSRSSLGTIRSRRQTLYPPPPLKGKENPSDCRNRKPMGAGARVGVGSSLRQHRNSCSWWKRTLGARSR